MMFKKTEELWRNLSKSSSTHQRSDLYEIVVEKYNFGYHHNLIYQIEVPKMTEKQIYKARRLITLLNKHFKKRGSEFFVIDFFVDTDDNTIEMYSKTGEIRRLYASMRSFEHKSMDYVFKYLKFRLKIGDFFDNYAWDYQLTRPRISLFYKIWNIPHKSKDVDTAEMLNLLKKYLESNYNDFYSEEQKARAVISRINRKRELIKKEKLIDQIPFEERIWGNEYSKLRVDVLDGINRAKEFQYRYYKYGLKHENFDRIIIDLIIKKKEGVANYDILFVSLDGLFLRIVGWNGNIERDLRNTGFFADLLFEKYDRYDYRRAEVEIIYKTRMGNIKKYYESKWGPLNWT